MAIMINVFRAFNHSIGLKTGTPLLIASMPVRAVQPAEKACMMRNKDSGAIAGGAEAAKVLGNLVTDAWIKPYNSIPMKEKRKGIPEPP